MTSPTRQREEKSRLLARYAWRLGWTSAQLGDLVEHLAEKSRSRNVPTLAKFAREAYAAGGRDDVRPPSSRLSPTWKRARLKLDQMAERERIGLDVPCRDLRARAGYWLAEPQPLETVSAGWAAIAALGPVEPPQECRKCAAPAVLWTVDGWICAAHPPVEGDWGWRLKWQPQPCGWPIACYCGRHPPGPKPVTPPAEPARVFVLDPEAVARARRPPVPHRAARTALRERAS